jgi:hypothetical protein
MDFARAVCSAEAQRAQASRKDQMESAIDGFSVLKTIVSEAMSK